MLAHRSTLDLPRPRHRAANPRGRAPHDFATYTEARAVYLAHPGDLCVGRTAPWREAVRLRGTPAVDIAHTQYYYLSHALLVLARDHDQGRKTPLPEIITWLRQRPDAIVRLYALDVETQIFLLWLRRQAGLDHLEVEANSPVVSSRWNRKSHIHPSAAQVLDLPVEGLDAAAVLRAEQQHSEAHQRLGMTVPVLPGYLIARDGVDARPATRVVRPGLLRHDRHAAYCPVLRIQVQPAAMRGWGEPPGTCIADPRGVVAAAPHSAPRPAVATVTRPTRSA